MTRVQYDRNSWIIDGKRLFILSAAVHYFRLPRAEWAEVLDKSKEAGCNCIETYVPWNWHEEEEGRWDFSGDKDLGAFLDLCAERGLYVIVRPGPYICAEWDMGGLPYWLERKPGMQYRTLNREFLRYVDLYWDRLVPIVLPRLFSKSGTVIMVQVENEFQALGKPDKAYMEYLRDGLKERGIDVPLVTCYGAVDGAVEFRNFWSHAEEHARTLEERFAGQPKGVLEFWIGWFEQWGGPRADQKTASQVERKTYELIREGFTAINYYMFFGGTNFGHWGGRTIGEHTFMTTSYDYDAALDEYLRPTAKYKALKLVHDFVRWMEPLLTENADSTAFIPLGKHSAAKKKSGPQGTILFIHNDDTERLNGMLDLQKFGIECPPQEDTDSLQAEALRENGRQETAASVSGQAQAAKPISPLPYTVEAGAILPVVCGVDIGSIGSGVPVTLEAMTGFTTGFDRGRGTVYHEAGQQSALVLSAGGLRGLEADCPLPQRVHTDEEGRLVFTLFHGKRPQTITVRHGGTELARITVTNRAAVETEAASVPAARGTAPLLTDWQQAGEQDAAKGDSREAEAPLDFTSFGRFSGYLAYEAEVDSAEEAVRTLTLPRIEDPARVYVNGRYAGQTTEIGAAALDIPLRQGSNRLRILVQNMGRYNFTQTLAEPKGLSAMPSLDGVTADLTEGWQVDGAGRVHSLRALPEIEGRIGLYRTLHTGGPFDSGVIVGYGLSRLRVNGRQVVPQLYNETAWNRVEAPYGVADIGSLLREGSNELEFDAQGITHIPKMKLYLYASASQISGWVTSGAADPAGVTDWSPLETKPETGPNAAEMPSVETVPGRDKLPRWFKASFEWEEESGGTDLKHTGGADDTVETGTPDGAKLKITLDGLSKGILWVNGFCLGRYWQIGPQESYKIPVSLLKKRNEVLLYDEEGCHPEGVRLELVSGTST
ncbi:beta-galactosidase [Paenibacillus sp. UNC499MF]|uniref:beta-galactosidase n=1 Tax=Paenibacillus sp. UNC499MF TaxID=1502751 RepID=UPI00089FCFD9|nr:beta-galactosidase [Paenibacillus sp. UNC499MF]SEF84584.1 Glycosyl hydrolases family 35 [Paenibacillus sp. UNC499MF]